MIWWQYFWPADTLQSREYTRAGSVVKLSWKTNRPELRKSSKAFQVWVEKPLDLDEVEDELIKLELLQLEEPVEQTVELSDDKNKPNPQNKLMNNLLGPQSHAFLSKIILLTYISSYWWRFSYVQKLMMINK